MTDVYRVLFRNGDSIALSHALWNVGYEGTHLSEAEPIAEALFQRITVWEVEILRALGGVDSVWTHIRCYVAIDDGPDD